MFDVEFILFKMFWFFYIKDDCNKERFDCICIYLYKIIYVVIVLIFLIKLVSFKNY